jgi:hypothetical protein
MSATIRFTAWICIFSTGFLGCTSTTLIQPEAENGEELYSGQIESVVTKDGTKYEFEGVTGNIAAGMIRGISGGKAVAIPLSDVDKVLVRENNTGLTILLVVGVAAVVALVIVAVAAKGNGSNTTLNLSFGK